MLIGEKLIDIVRHMAESNCVGYYRRTYEHLGLFCQAYNISANVDFGEAGPLLRLINDKHLQQTLTETPSHKKFNEYRIAQLTKILAGDQAAHQEYIRSVKDLIKGFIILHNIYTGSTLDNQVRSQHMVQGLQLMNPKLTDKCLKSILPTKRDVSLAGLKALEKYLFGVYVDKQMGRKNAFAFNLSLDGWQSISKEETLGVVYSNSNFFWSEGFKLSAKDGESTLKQFKEVIQHAREKFKVKVNCFITDNASPNVYAKKILAETEGFKHIFFFCCHAHQVNLLCKQVYENYLFDVLDQANTLANQAMRSKRFREILKEEVTYFYGKGAAATLKPIFRIRWNTSYLCLRSFIYIYRAVIAASRRYALIDRKSDLSKISQATINKFYRSAKVLLPLVEANLICQLETATVADVLHSYFTIYHSFENIKDTAVRHKLQNNLSYRWYKMNQMVYLYGYLVSTKYYRCSRKIFNQAFPREKEFHEVDGQVLCLERDNPDNQFWGSFRENLASLIERHYMPIIGIPSQQRNAFCGPIADALARFLDLEEGSKDYSNIMANEKLSSCQSSVWYSLRSQYRTEFADFNSFVLELKPQTADCERLFSVYGFIKTVARHRMKNAKMAVQANIKVILRRNFKRRNQLGNTYKTNILDLGERQAIDRDAQSDIVEQEEETKLSTSENKTIDKRKQIRAEVEAIGIPSSPTTSTSEGFEDSESVNENDEEGGIVLEDDSGLLNESSDSDLLSIPDDTQDTPRTSCPSVYSEHDEEFLQGLDACKGYGTMNFNQMLKEHLKDFKDDSEESPSAVHTAQDIGTGGYVHENGKVRFDSLYLLWAEANEFSVNFERAVFIPDLYSKQKRRSKEQVALDRENKEKRRQDFRSQYLRTRHNSMASHSNINKQGEKEEEEKEENDSELTISEAELASSGEAESSQDTELTSTMNKKAQCTQTTSVVTSVHQMVQSVQADADPDLEDSPIRRSKRLQAANKKRKLQ